MSDIATKANWFINSASQGNKRIKRLKDWSISDGRSKETVGEVGSDDHVAFMRKPGGKTIAFGVRLLKEARPYIDWDALAESDEVFSLTCQITGGERFQFPACQVSKFDQDGDENGENSGSVEIVGTTKRKL